MYDAGMENRIPSGLATDTNSVSDPEYKNICRVFDDSVRVVMGLSECII